MKFGEKVRAARLAAKYSQRQLADMTGIALRTIQNYESGERLPKQKENYQLLATALNVDVDTLKDDDADFVIKATEKYGARGNAQAERLVKEVSGLYAGGELAEEDMDDESHSRGLLDSKRKEPEIRTEKVQRHLR